MLKILANCLKKRAKNTLLFDFYLFYIFIYFIFYFIFYSFSSLNIRVITARATTLISVKTYVIILEVFNNIIYTSTDSIHSQKSSHLSSLDYRDIVEIQDIYSEYPDCANFDKGVALNFDTILSKPFHVDSFAWTTTDDVGFLKNYLAPYGLVRNVLANIPFETSGFWRGNICVIVSVSGTQLHQGTLLVGAVPTRSYDIVNSSLGTPNYNVNSLMASPHLFLSPNVATAMCLSFPFYYPVHYAKTFNNTSSLQISDNICKNSGNLIFHVLNPLTTSATGSSSLSVNVSVKFDKLQFFVPKYAGVSIFNAESLANTVSGYIDGFFNGLKNLSADFLDSARGALRGYTGLHNPNLPVIEHTLLSRPVNRQNIVEGPNYYEQLDPYVNFTRLLDKPLFNTKVDEMDMSYLLSKRQFIGTFAISATDAEGALVLNVPISPMQSNGTTAVTNTIQETFYYISRYWRGTVNFHFQSVMTNFHFFKLLAVRDYNPLQSTAIPIPVPAMMDVVNLPSESMEFSGGGQIATVSCPFYQEKEQQYCSMDYLYNALFNGSLRVYLQQPLVVSASVPNTVYVNVYISLSDFNFYGYNNNIAFLGQVNRPLPPDEATMVQENPTLLARLEESAEEEVISVYEAESGEVPYNVGDQLDVVDHEADFAVNEHNLRPILSTRDYFRRFQPVILSGTVTSINVFDLLRLSSHNKLLSMYYAFFGSVRIKIIFPAMAVVYYFPPHVQASTPSPATIQPRSITTFGAPTVIPTTVCTSSVANDGVRTFAEFVVPFNSPFKFCSLQNRATVAQYESAFVQPENDLGVITAKLSNGNAVNLANAAIFIGFGDDARMGFQTCVTLDSTSTSYVERFLGTPLTQPNLYFYKSV